MDLKLKPMAPIERVKHAIRHKFAWPGGYPLFLITSDAAALCVDCGRKQWRSICAAIRGNLRDGWQVEAVDINYEDPSLYCDHCSKRIESDYAEDQAVDRKA